MGVKRGDLVTVVAPGDYGKPRPALIVQSDDVADTASVMILLLTSDVHHDGNLFRKRIAPSVWNGLRLPSDVMVDKIMSLDRSKIGSRIGQLEELEVRDITALLALILGMPSAPA